MAICELCGETVQDGDRVIIVLSDHWTGHISVNPEDSMVIHRNCIKNIKNTIENIMTLSGLFKGGLIE